MTTKKRPSAKTSSREPKRPKKDVAAAHTPYRIEIRFLGGLSENQKQAFRTAAARWGAVIENNLPAVQVGSDHIQGCLIQARGATIDGEGKILGQAGPTALRPGSLIPAKGSMEFDT